MENKKKIRIAAVVTAVLFMVVMMGSVLSQTRWGRQSMAALSNEKNVAVIRVSGPIVGGDSDNMGLGSTSSTTSGSLMRQFRKARKDDSVKAVLLRIDSPGGSAAATQETAEELQRLKEAGKPVIVSMGDTTASGAYWLAAYGDKVYANPSTITGSIGVYMSYYDVQGLSKKIGVNEEKIKSGAHKDIFSPFRPMTDEERQLTQTMVDTMYEQFVDVVASQRHMDKDTVRTLADGRVFTGSQAKEAGLVDEMGNYYDALAYAGKLIHAQPDHVAIVTYGDEFSLRQVLQGHVSLAPFMQSVFGARQDIPIPLLILKGVRQE